MFRISNKGSLRVLCRAGRCVIATSRPLDMWCARVRRQVVSRMWQFDGPDVSLRGSYAMSIFLFASGYKEQSHAAIECFSKFSETLESLVLKNPTYKKCAIVPRCNMKIWNRYRETIRANSHLGFTCFGGPAVHIQTFHKRFVEDLEWIDEPMV